MADDFSHEEGESFFDLYQKLYDCLIHMFINADITSEKTLKKRKSHKKKNKKDSSDNSDEERSASNSSLHLNCAVLIGCFDQLCIFVCGPDVMQQKIIVSDRVCIKNPIFSNAFRIGFCMP